MSWEAVTWATKQRMKSSHEQLVLLVLANCADPDGVAFSRWPGREHWWKYLVDLTRLSKSTLFRDINTLADLGLCSRSVLVMADGTRRPTIQLDLGASYHHEKTAHSHTGNETEEEPDEAENASDISDNDEPISEGEIHSHTGNDEIHSPSRTNPFPVVGMHKDSLLVPKNSPLPPSGGLSAVDDGFEDFVKVWGEPIQKFALTRAEWSKIASDKRGELIASAKGYWAWIAAHPKKPATQSAQAFVRDQAGWGQWLRYVPDAGNLAPSFTSIFPMESPEARALVALYEIAGKSDFLRTFMVRNGAVTYQRPMTPRLLALSQAGPRDHWPSLTRQQAGAWEELLRDAVTVQVRNHLREGQSAPWPWPPRKDGTLSATGPPETLMSDQDTADFK